MKQEAGCKITDLGLVTALGTDLDSTWERLRAGDTSHLSTRDDLIPGESRVFGAVTADVPAIPKALARYDCRNNRLSLGAFAGIREPVDRAIARFGAGRVGIVGGSSTGGLAEAERAIRHHKQYGRLPSSFDLVQLEYGGVCEFIQQVSGARGPAYTVSTACSTGAKALVSARRLLSLGICDAVIAGAVDSLCQLTANGFFALQAMSDDRPNPMSVNRDGLILGEAAAWFLLTRDMDGIQLLGAGETSDAHHMSAPDPTGRGAEDCMRAALADAQISGSDVAYLNLHGTATPHNDSMESIAVSHVFGQSVPCSSTKPLVGHTLGASGAVEAAFCWLVLARADTQRLELPPHRFDGRSDPDLPELRLLGEGQSVNAGSIPRVMSNSFGFGGTNCSVILGGVPS